MESLRDLRGVEIYTIQLGFGASTPTALDFHNCSLSSLQMRRIRGFSWMLVQIVLIYLFLKFILEH